MLKTGGFAFSACHLSGERHSGYRTGRGDPSLARLRPTKHTLNALARKPVSVTMELNHALSPLPATLVSPLTVAERRVSYPELLVIAVFDEMAAGRPRSFEPPSPGALAPVEAPGRPRASGRRT
jgi:hypothetical protein